MAKRYKEAPWWWYIAVLVLSFVLGLIVVTTQNVTLPAWAYVVALLLGIFIAPLVSLIACINTSANANCDTEHLALLSLWQRHCHQQPVKDVGRSDPPGTPHRQHVFCCLVAQCHQQRC
jgi:hypothetical protein